MKPLTNHITTLIVGVAVVASACTSAGPTGDTGNPGDFVQYISGNAVLEVTVLETSDALPEMVGVYSGDWPGEHIRVERVLWDATGTAKSEQVTLAQNSGHPEFDVGNRYLFFLSYFPDLPVQWAVKFATDLDGNPVPGYDTPQTRESLGRLLLPGETNADLVNALVEFSKERDAWLAAEAEVQEGLPQTGRRSVHWLGEQAHGPLQVFLDKWNTTPPEERYLPLEPSDLPSGAEETLGMVFVPYEVVVIDDGTLADADSLALRFPDIGILGNFIVDHDTGITTIIGYGPQGRTAALEALGTGERPRTIRVLGSINPTHRREPIDPDDEAVTAVVTIANGNATIQVVSRDEYDKTIMSLQDHIETRTPTGP